MPSKATSPHKPRKTAAPARPRKSTSPARNAAAIAATDTQAAYTALVARFRGRSRITLPAEKRGKFGSNGLKVDGKVFAMLIGRGLAVKLPAQEVESATKAGRGEPLTMGRRVMKEWLLVNEPPPKWYAIAERARVFVADSA